MARGDRANSIRNLTYTVDSVDIAPGAGDLGDALAGTPVDSSVTATVPKDLPQSLINLTRDVTAGADTPALKAAAIQAYLRSGRFTYTTEALPGSGYRALENFLLRDRKGYCEQFATAMAMMARIEGIPSRVAVGFLPGERNGDHWEVTIRDMHAWPELYFSGFGWVRFEPTPASVTGTAPAWTVPDEDNPSGEPSEEATAAPSTEASAPSAGPSAAPDEQTTETATDTAFPWGRTLLGSGVGLVALLILAAPATIRGRRRSERLTADGPAEERVEAAWEEIRDTVLDYGGSWPEGSPRAIGGEIGHRLQGEDSDTMTRVATLVERSRYARAFTDEEATRSLPGMAQDIRRGIAQPQSRWRRFRAVVLPTSLFQRRS
jgi:transglutaminase-like putative cysteine protease